MARIAKISSRPIAGVPASISGTPARASARAMATFSAVENATPGACSPSRSVVSFSTTFECATSEPKSLAMSLIERERRSLF